MRLATKERQAVAAMIDVALHQDAGPVALPGVAGRQRISLSYLEQMFGALRRGQLVTATRGASGGYKTARDAKFINVADIIFAVDDRKMSKRSPPGPSRDVESPTCLAPELWTSLSEHVLDFLRSVTLQQLVDDHASAGVGSGIHDRATAGKMSRLLAPVRPNAPNSVFQLAYFAVD